MKFTPCRGKQFTSFSKCQGRENTNIKYRSYIILKKKPPARYVGPEIMSAYVFVVFSLHYSALLRGQIICVLHIRTFEAFIKRVYMRKLRVYFLNALTYCA